MSRALRFAALGFATVLAVVPGRVVAQENTSSPSKLTVDRIYGTRDFEAERVSIRWLPNGKYAKLEPSTDPGGGRDLVTYDPASGKREVFVSSADLIPTRASSPLVVDDYSLSADGSRLLIFTNSQRVWRANTRGDYWVLDRTSHELRKLGGDAKSVSLMHAKFSPAGDKVAYVSWVDHNLWVEDLKSLAVRKLSDAATLDEINGSFDWVYEEEFSLRDGFRWSPDGRAIAFWHLNTKGVREVPLVNNTDGLYPHIFSFKYPKVGETNSECRVVVVNVEDGNTRWLFVPGDPREHYIASLEWARSGLLFQQFNRLQNTDRVMMAKIVEEKRFETAWPIDTILTERDDAWVDLNPGMPLILPDGFLWLSERDGWRHLYRVGWEGKEPTKLTTGDFDVIQVEGLDRESKTVYFLASPDNPTQRYLYKVGLDGSNLARVTPNGQAGTHAYDLSPDGRWAVHTFSTAETPPMIDLVRLPGHERVRKLVDNAALIAKLDALPKVTTEFFRVDVGGVALDAWRMTPPGLDTRAKAKYPLVVHVYGEPAGATVLDAWQGDNALWHRMLAQDGYVVASIDNRGTATPRGRAWRKSIHRKVGVLAPVEQAEALNAILRDRPYIDPARVGVWGWSGGGSMSLNAIFKYPDLYALAIAVAPVSNQRYYDTIYQERYMGLPGDNVDGFAQGSPINFARNLKGKLLLIHGTGDDNCHYQGTEALINELIRHDKPFTMMAYPNRSHAINEGQNTTRHLRRLMTRFLKENLPAGAP